MHLCSSFKIDIGEMMKHPVWHFAFVLLVAAVSKYVAAHATNIPVTAVRNLNNPTAAVTNYTIENTANHSKTHPELPPIEPSSDGKVGNVEPCNPSTLASSPPVQIASSPMIACESFNYWGPNFDLNTVGIIETHIDSAKNTTSITTLYSPGYDEQDNLSTFHRSDTNSAGTVTTTGIMPDPEPLEPR